MERKLSCQSHYNRKIEPLCTLLSDRLAQTATLLCETLEVQVKIYCFNDIIIRNWQLLSDNDKEVWYNKRRTAQLHSYFHGNWGM